MHETCGFCERAGVSREHIFATWLTRSVKRRHRIDRFHATLTRTRLRHTWTGRPRIGGGIDLVAWMPCTACNNGWMSRLEDRARPFLEQMIFTDRAGPLALDLSAQALVAAWAVKTTMVIEYVSDERPTYYTQGERRQMRDALTIPEDVRISIGHQRGAFRCHASPNVLRFQHPNGQLIPGHSSTFVIGGLVLQVFSYRQALGEFEKFRVRQGPWSTALLGLWPPQSEPLLWPPDTPLTDDELVILSDRFSVDEPPPSL